MSLDDTQKAEFDRLKKRLQDTILTQYPNPERKGCPGAVTLRELASHDPSDADIEKHPHWYHVTHCSECYREFLAFRFEYHRPLRKRRRTTALLVAAIAILVIGISALLFSRSRRPQIAETVYRRQIVDLQGLSLTRSPESDHETKPIVLRREPEELIMRLPFGTPAGTYQVQLLKTADAPLVSVTGQAHVENGITTLIAQADLSKFTAGKYFIAIRHVPWDWTYCPVIIR